MQVTLYIPKVSHVEQAFAYGFSLMDRRVAYEYRDIRSSGNHAGSLQMRPLVNETVAVVLAGGKGLRLGPLTRNRCKPALHFGGAYRSIDFTLSNCVNSGVRRVGVATQYQPNSLVPHIQQGWRHLNRMEFGEFIDIWPAEQRRGSSGYAGTADAVFQNLPNLDRLRPRYVLVLAADHVYRMNYGDILAFHQESGAGVTVACQPVPAEQARHFGIVSVDRHRVREFHEKPRHVAVSPPPLASMGIYVFDAGLVRDLLTQDADRPDSSHDFGRDVIPSCVRSGDIRVHAYSFSDPCTGGAGYWRDIGTIDAYWAASMELLDPRSGLDLRDPRWPIWSIPMRRAPTRILPDDHGACTRIASAIVGNGCDLAAATVRRSVLSDNVCVGAGSLVEDSVLLPNVRVGSGCHLRRVIVDEGVEVPDGTCVGNGTFPVDASCDVSANGISVLSGFDDCSNFGWRRWPVSGISVCNEDKLATDRSLVPEPEPKAVRLSA
jgi:glucose-1-phosphate adenylyltransferase